MNTRIFPRLSTAILTKDFTQALPTSNVTPTTKPSSDSTPRATYRKIFSRLSTAIFTYSGSGGALPPTLPLRQQHIRIPLLTLPTQHFFPPLYHQFKLSWSGGALPPTSTLHQHQTRIHLLALPTLASFPDSLRPFSPFTKRWSLTSNVTPTPQPPCPPYAKTTSHAWPHTTLLHFSLYPLIY